MNSPDRSLSCSPNHTNESTTTTTNSSQNQHLKQQLLSTKQTKSPSPPPPTQTNANCPPSNDDPPPPTNNHCSPTTTTQTNIVRPASPATSCYANNTEHPTDNDDDDDDDDERHVNDDNQNECEQLRADDLPPHSIKPSKSNNSLASHSSQQSSTIDANHHRHRHHRHHRNHSADKRGSASSSRSHVEKTRIVIRKFQKLDESQLSSTPAPDVKIGQRVAYKEYYGNEFGTIRWIGRVPQICPDWTAGVEFDNAIGEGDGSLNGRRYFIAKDCFAKFLPLNAVAFVDQHVGRPEPGTMISVMSAAARPGQMISIQRVSTVHVQHCFLNAPHQIPGADILAVNTRLHCQCPNCGPCAHVIKPPRTQRLARSKKNATHMCQFSTYTCCGMESQEEAMCTYTGNKATSSMPPHHGVLGSSSTAGLPPIGNSWIEGSGYLTNLQAHQTKSIPDEFKADGLFSPRGSKRHSSRPTSRGGSGRRHGNKAAGAGETIDFTHPPPPPPPPEASLPSPPAVGGEFGSAGAGDDWSTTQSPFPAAATTNNAMRDPPSYSPNPDYVNFGGATAAPANQQTSNLLAAAAAKKYTPYEEPVWCESNVPKTTTTQQKGGPGKVVYRDSIENRYLFPTDEPMDSTLEADLENLSQARYGHSTNSRLNGSKNIFKSLRSLVSCLSAQSNHSEIMERRSENTLKYSEYGDSRGTGNKAMPDIITQQAPVNDDFLVNSYANSVEKEDLAYLGLEKKVPPANTYYNDDCPMYGTKHTTTNHQHHHYKQPPAHEAGPNADANSNQKTIVRHISSSSDCGFSSASLNSINFQSYQTYSPKISAKERQKRNQICNNFLASLMKSTTMNEEDLSRLRRMLFEPHIDNCCLHSIINQVSVGTYNEDPERLLSNGLKKSCMFHGCDRVERPSSACNHSTNHLPSYNQFGFEPTKMRELKNSEGFSPIASQQHSHMKHSNNSQERSLIDGSTTSESMTMSSYESFNGTAVVGDNQSTTSNADGLKNKENKTRTESEKSISTSSALPKAFELKLTLSINNNSETNKDLNHEQAANEPIEVTTGLVDETNGLNSTFNINIVSNKSEDSTEKKVVSQKEDDCLIADSL